MTKTLWTYAAFTLFGIGYGLILESWLTPGGLPLVPVEAVAFTAMGLAFGIGFGVRVS